ncbi:MAG TPA: hypothetical protein VIR01_07745 [Pyrinomonadaceae bacterium]
MGWAGLTNGTLLELAQNQFDVLLTGDLNLSFQQNVKGFDIAVVVLQAGSTRLIDILKLIPQVLTSLETIQPGQVVRVFHER